MIGSLVVRVHVIIGLGMSCYCDWQPRCESALISLGMNCTVTDNLVLSVHSEGLGIN